MLNEDIDAADYKSTKTECESKIRVLEARISELRSDFISSTEVTGLVEGAINNLTRIDVIYCKSDSESKRKIISLLCPQKFALKNLKLRTINLNLIYLIYNGLEDKKSETNDLKSTLYRWVLPAIHFSNSFLDQLKKISDFRSSVDDNDHVDQFKCLCRNRFPLVNNHSV